MKRTKIIATIGPASEKAAVLRRMIKAGADVCRLNFSFGTEEEHNGKIKMIRELSAESGKSLAILQDLQGPKIRVGQLKEPVEVKKGDRVFLSGKEGHRETMILPTTYSEIASDTEAGKSILMADGKIILQVISTNAAKKVVECEVSAGGTILTGKGINLPYTKISLPALTPKDRRDAIFGARAGVDFMGLSFVRQAEDVLQLRRLLKKENSPAKIIAKLEKPEALDNLDDILEVVDGVMVARGDLAVELSFAKVPFAQKHIIHSANRKGLITIVATEMLGSMVDNTLPTRAEASDVANGVFDGADAVMLSNESATGKYPVKAVQAMADIIFESEKAPFMNDLIRRGLDLPETHEMHEAMCESAAHLSWRLDEEAILVITSTGTTARIMSKFHPQCNIIAATRHEDTYHRMAFYRNVTPVLMNKDDGMYDESGIHHAVDKLISELRRKRLVRKGDRLIVLNAVSHPKAIWKENSISIKTVT